MSFRNVTHSQGSRPDRHPRIRLSSIPIPGTKALLGLFIGGAAVLTGPMLHAEESMVAESEAPAPRKVNWEKAPFSHELDSPFSPQAALQLAAKADKSRDEIRHLMFMILQASVEKTPELRPLLHDAELKQQDDRWHSLGLALAAYDFSINDKPKALQFIFDQLAKEPVGSDAQAAIPLGFIDEWEDTIAAHEKHFARTDGAGATASMLFWQRRRFLYPEEFRRFHEERLKAAKIDADSLRGVWRGGRDGVRVELRFGDTHRWQVRHEGRLIETDLTTIAHANGRLVTLLAPRAEKGRVPCGRLHRAENGDLLLAVWPDTSEATPYPRVRNMVIEKADSP